MTGGETPPSDRLEGWSEEWRWFAAALVLLIPADLLSTLLAVSRHGLAVEANPIVRWLLSRGLLYVVVANLAVALVVIAAFWTLLAAVRRTPYPHRVTFERLVAAWLRALVAVGVLVVANNLLVAHGTSLP